MDRRPFCPPDEADRLVRSVIPYVRKTAAFRARFMSHPRRRADYMDELVAAGLAGVATALVKFKPEYGWKFFTYAKYWIDQHIQNCAARRRKDDAFSGRTLGFDGEGAENLAVAEVKTTFQLDEWEKLVAGEPCPKARLILDLRYRKGMLLREISKVLGARGTPMTHEGVRLYLKRSYRRIKAYQERNQKS